MLTLETYSTMYNN